MPQQVVIDVRDSEVIWDNPHHEHIYCGFEKRIVLQSGQPGDVFEIQQQAEGRFLLVRLEKPERTVRRMTKKSSIEAMRKAPLRSTITWDKLRQLTREP